MLMNFALPLCRSHTHSSQFSLTFLSLSSHFPLTGHKVDGSMDAKQEQSTCKGSDSQSSLYGALLINSLSLLANSLFSSLSLCPPPRRGSRGRASARRASPHTRVRGPNLIKGIGCPSPPFLPHSAPHNPTRPGAPPTENASSFSDGPYAELEDPFCARGARACDACIPAPSLLLPCPSQRP